MLNDDQLLRYSRQIMLPEVDIAGQEAWLNASVLIIGVGGLGSPVAMYLAASGVGRLVLVDDDQVELTNLQRQIVHRTETIGMAKVDSAKATLAALNPDTQVVAINARLDAAALEKQVSESDLVVDCCDNFTTRFAVNAACVKHKTPLVSGAAIRLEGQVAVFDSRREDAPCYRCLYRDGDEENLTCAESGVLAPLVGIIGSVQAMEALKVLADLGEPLVGRLLLLDGRHMDWRTLTLRRDPECPCCGDKYN
ncbi:molybdopterin-synthase adenylyltransferase MoeB [Amphritea sp.]|uniref:molybdopterin-synthase adenylyltransferase MoeB n=1 Tax=Amphritea sp. TaxID=1872502 RepID=UPI003D0A79B9